MNVAARAIRLEQGDEVLSTDLEYGALDLTWERVCADVGARYVRMPVRLPVESAVEIVDAVWAGPGPHTRVLFLSHHTSGTAMTLPVEELCRRVRERGIRTIVDGRARSRATTARSPHAGRGLLRRQLPQVAVPFTQNG